MFTGIVAGLAEVSDIKKQDQLWQLTLSLPDEACGNFKTGASIAVNGTCLTIVEWTDRQVVFDVMMETLRLTNLNTLCIGKQVNIERAAHFGDEIGGHLLSGHIYDQAEIIAIDEPENNRIITLKTAPQWTPYILSKGFIALDGASLTVNEVHNNHFKVYLIPETCRVTTLGLKKVGNKVNMEIDSQTQVIVETVHRVLKSRDSS